MDVIGDDIARVLRDAHYTSRRGLAKGRRVATIGFPSPETFHVWAVSLDQIEHYSMGFITEHFLIIIVRMHVRKLSFIFAKYTVDTHNLVYPLMTLTSASGSSISAQGVTHTNSHSLSSSSLLSADGGLVGVVPARLGLEGLDIVFHFLCFIMFAEMCLGCHQSLFVGCLARFEDRVARVSRWRAAVAWRVRMVPSSCTCLPLTTHVPLQ